MPDTGGLILIVEDDDDTRFLLGNLFEEEGYRVTEAATTEDAWARLHSQPPIDLIVLDIRLPGAHGWSFLARQKLDRKICGVPVVIYSALPFALPADELPDGVCAYVAKPTNLDQLLSAVARCIRKRSGGGA